MKRVIKRTKIPYYVALNKENNTIIVTTSKTEIAHHLGICTKSVARYINTLLIYNDDTCTIWSHIFLKVKKTGFKLPRKINYY